MCAEEGKEKSEPDAFARQVMRERVIARFLTSNPFSTVENANYSGILDPHYFREHFYVDEGLEDPKKEIFTCLSEERKNTIIVFGYRGCGKTTFVNYLLEDAKARPLNGRCIGSSLIDFEKERERETDSKFKTGLIRLVKKELNGFVDGCRDGRWLEERRQCFNAIFEAATHLVADYEIEGEISGFTSVYNDIPVLPAAADVEAVLDSLRAMSISSILFVLTFFLFCSDVYATGHARFKRLIVFDNLDDELDEMVISDFINSYISYSTASVGLFNSLRDLDVEGFDLSQAGFYENFAFVFCLRDTNVAKFTTHMIDRPFVCDCDISDSVKRRDIIEKRLRYLNGLQLTEKAQSQKLIFSSMLEDRYVFDSVYPLFNGGCRTATNTIFSVMVDGNIDRAEEYVRMVRAADGYGAPLFGAHGIMLRLLFDLFRKNKYFSEIGGESNEFSVPRIILTLLYNRLPRARKGITPIGNMMYLSDLRDRLGCVKDVTDTSFCNNVYSMYSLLDAKNWVHLLELDSDTAVSANSLLREVQTGVRGKRNTTLYITSAGRMFVETVSSHFEYFSSRYVPGSSPLFCAENLENDDEGLELGALLESVFEQVEKCCERVEMHDRQIMDAVAGGDFERYCNSGYVLRKNGTAQTHVERVIMHHISYLDSYRQFVLEVDKAGIKTEELREEHLERILDKKDEILGLLVGGIRHYVDLLSEYEERGYITPSGRSLLQEFKDGLEKVEAGADPYARISAEPKMP